MTIYTLTPNARNELPEIVPTDVLEIPIEVAALMIAHLGEHHFHYEGRHYWWAKVSMPMRQVRDLTKPLTILTRDDGTAAVFYHAGCTWSRDMLMGMIQELIVIETPLIVRIAA